MSPAPTERKLGLVHAEGGPASVAGADVRVWLSLTAAGALDARFAVTGLPIRAERDLSQGVSQWGLWDWDVVEVFVAPRGATVPLPYYEFQVSPLNQYFELEIFEPRARFNREFASGFRHDAVIEGPTAWRATMSIPLAELGWDGKSRSVAGNVYAILGEPGKRSYWALSLPPTDRPDFHLPRHFTALAGT